LCVAIQSAPAAKGALFLIGGQNFCRDAASLQHCFDQNQCAIATVRRQWTLPAPVRRVLMITTETLLPIWTSVFAAIGCFFAVRAILRKKSGAKKDPENKE
jgi:hypothetical protein